MLLEIYFEIQLKLYSAIFIMLTFSVTVLQLRGICIALTKACVYISATSCHKKRELMSSQQACVCY